MNKADLIKYVADYAHMKRDDALLAIDGMTSAIINAVKDGNKVTLIGFGTFLPSERKEREGRNPRTGEPIQIPAARVPKFVAGSAFKESVNIIQEEIEEVIEEPEKPKKKTKAKKSKK